MKNIINLVKILRAMKNNSEISAKYKYKDGSIRDVKIKPYNIKFTRAGQYGKGLYVDALVGSTQEDLTYKLTRFIRVK